ncbi:MULTISPECIES: hypothetical protein [Spirosoma]|uniref:Uncharacterized protein n=1 Tax=Spirosoma sordidisoli TaxID=2502893 RepID=A0A4Q2UJ99_9BACT|nr:MULTISPECIES: hypothetical protein [Spirosoma]RYC67500.1 hypothetical protein EQG79_22570 [Spirosoma sordidisoli]
MQTPLPLLGWALTGLVLAGLAVLINGCQPVTDSLRPQATEADKSQAVRAYIRSLGCPDSLIQDAGDHFIADGDMLFSKLKDPRCGCFVAGMYEIEVQTVYTDDSLIPSRSDWSDTALLYSR